MRHLALIAAATASLALLAACQTQQVDATPPTVTYTLNDRDDLDEVALQADAHCERNYGLDAELVDRDRTSNGYQVTFACD